MKTTPKTDQQLAEESMLPAGEYDFSVVSAVEKISRKSREAGYPDADMIEVSLTVFGPNGERRVKDWLMDKVAYKIKHFAYAVGLGQDYENGGIDPHTLVGRCGKLILKQGKPNGDFAPRNEVKDYVVVGKETVKAPSAAKLPAAAAPGVDEPPF